MLKLLSQDMMEIIRLAQLLNVSLPTSISQDFGFFYLQLWSPFLPKSALESEAPEILAQLILLLLLWCVITAQAEQAVCQGNVAFFPGKFHSSQTKLH